MKKRAFMILSFVMVSSMVFSKDFEVKALLGKHSTDNPYGEWVLEEKNADDPKYYNDIKTELHWGVTYNHLLAKSTAKSTDEYPETTDIEIIDIAYYKKVFVAQKYYEFYWKKKIKEKNANPKMNDTISNIPVVILHIKNLNKEEIMLLFIQNKNIFQSGGEASPGAREDIKPKLKKGMMEISYDKTDTMTFPGGYKMPASKELDLPLSLWVKNATHGDGTGTLTYALELHYMKNNKKYTEVLTIISQSDEAGYNDGGIPIAPAK